MELFQLHVFQTFTMVKDDLQQNTTHTYLFRSQSHFVQGNQFPGHFVYNIKIE